jgi:RNA polymerase sigma-70 factor (ECF subfamily)
MFLVHAARDEFALPLDTAPGPTPEAGTPELTPQAGTPERASDAELVLRAQDGDRAAEEAIYRRHVRYVVGMVARLLDNRAEAEDCVQETFAIALERLRALRDGDALRAWIAQIAVSQVRRRYRKKKLLHVLGLDRAADPATLEGFAWTGTSPEVSADLARLHALLARLPSEQRIAWSLRHIEGHALEEVAALSGCSLATAKRRIAATEARVRATFEEGSS